MSFEGCVRLIEMEVGVFRVKVVVIRVKVNSSVLVGDSIVFMG